jgi:hypothetical protein
MMNNTYIHNTQKLKITNMANYYKDGRTKDWCSGKIYSAQRHSSRNRGHEYPNYSLSELRDWLYSQDLFHILYENWVNSGFEKDMAPSCDRLNDFQPYSLKNIQLMTWKENRLKNSKDRFEGVDNRVNRAVLQYSMDGEFIEKHYSLRSAARKNGLKYHTGIQGCCSGEYSSSSGFMWFYADSVPENFSPEKISKPKLGKPVIQMDLDGNFISEFENAKYAGDELGLHGTSITSCCKGRNKTCGGFKWKYKIVD